MELKIIQKHLCKTAYCVTKIIKSVFLALFGIKTTIFPFNLILNEMWNYSILN